MTGKVTMGLGALIAVFGLYSGHVGNGCFGGFVLGIGVIVVLIGIGLNE